MTDVLGSFKRGQRLEGQGQSLDNLLSFIIQMERLVETKKQNEFYRNLSTRREDRMGALFEAQRDFIESIPTVEEDFGAAQQAGRTRREEEARITQRQITTAEVKRKAKEPQRLREAAVREQAKEAQLLMKTAERERKTITKQTKDRRFSLLSTRTANLISERDAAAAQEAKFAVLGIDGEFTGEMRAVTWPGVNNRKANTLTKNLGAFISEWNIDFEDPTRDVTGQPLVPQEKSPEDPLGIRR